MPLSSMLTHAPRAVALQPSARCGRPGRCTWRRCSAGWRRPASCAHGRRRPTGPRRTGSTISSWRRVVQQRRRWPRARRPAPGPARCGWRCSSMRPRLTRDTSSRSSTSRVSCVAWRAITSSCRSRMRRGGRRMAHDLQRGQQRRQRVAQLVREHGQELVLAPLLVAQLGVEFGMLGACRLERARSARAPGWRSRARHRLRPRPVRCGIRTAAAATAAAARSRAAPVRPARARRRSAPARTPSRVSASAGRTRARRQVDRAPARVAGLDAGVQEGAPGRPAAQRLRKARRRHHAAELRVGQEQQQARRRRAVAPARVRLRTRRCWSAQRGDQVERGDTGHTRYSGSTQTTAVQLWKPPNWPFGARDLAVGVAADEARRLEHRRAGLELLVECRAQAQPRGDAIEDQRSGRAPAAERIERRVAWPARPRAPPRLRWSS